MSTKGTPHRGSGNRQARQGVSQAGRLPVELQRRRRAKRRERTELSKFIGVLVAIAIFGSSLGLAGTRVGTTKPLILQSSQAVLNQLLPISEDTTPSHQAELVSQLSSQLTPQHPQVSLGKALLTQLPEVTEETTAPPRAEFLAQVTPQVIGQGSQVSLNGRVFPVAWRQWQIGESVRTGISDVGLMQTVGMDLLSTEELTRQPIQWFSAPLLLASHLSGTYRYLDVTDFATAASWRLQVAGDMLQIASVPARVENIRMEPQPWGARIVIDLNRPTPWQISDRRTEGVITLEGLADSSLVERFKPRPIEQMQEAEDAAPVAVEEQDEMPVIRVENGQNQTLLRITAPTGKRLQVFSLPNPNRLVIDVRPDAVVEKDILWASGIWWRQRYVNLGESRFPVVWLEINPRTAGVFLRPMWSNPTTQAGTTPLIQMAPLWQATAAINAGFFNRNNRLPLGAIRREGRWFSGPILNRGAVAWNDNGQFKFGRFSLQETLITSTGERLPLLFLNSGYVKMGMARYTPEWGSTYTPLTDNEVLFIVQNDRVTGQLPGGAAGEQSFPIPTDGYLLTLRSDRIATNSLSIGTQVRVEQRTEPADFGSYPHILGAGPLLLENRKIALDAKAEQFSDAFSQQSAVRSCIGITADGTLLFAAVHYRSGGPGPNLNETAQLMQLLGAVDALNLDGGSSTGLYLGGQLLDRSPYTAARVHNGIGIFRPSLP